MMTKMLLGGLAGGLVLFAWSFLAHLPPLGTAGLKRLTPQQDAAVIASLGEAMKDRAVYPVWTGKFGTGPAAVIAYNPRPGTGMPAFFLNELLASLVAALLGAAIALGLSTTLGYWPRVLLIALIGVIGTIDVDAGYWNWYSFPTTYLLAQFVDHAGGWFLAGLVLARICRAG